MKKRWRICIVITLCIACFACLAACNPGGGDDGGGGEGGNNSGGGGVETNAADFSYITTNRGVMITAYNGTEKSITLPSKHPNGSPIVGISYELLADDSEKAPFENTVVEEIHIPESVTIMKNDRAREDEDMLRTVFFRAKNLKKITVAQDNPAYASRDGVLYDKAMMTLLACPYNIDALTVPEGVTKIAPNAFKYDYSVGNGIETAFNTDSQNIGAFSSKFTTVTLPYTLETFSFEGCRSLTSVDLSRTQVKEIKLGAFRQCISLKTVLLPDSLETIGTGAFQSSGIERITIPQNVRAIDLTPSQDGAVVTKGPAQDVFAFCRELTEITGPAQALFGENTSDLDRSNAYTGTNLFLGCHKLREIIVTGANGKAYAVTDYRYDTGWCSETDAANHTFRSLQKITYLNGCFNQLNTVGFTDFTARYQNVTIIK